MDADFLIPDAFWRELAEGYWGRKPGVFRRPSAVPFASAQDVFEVLVAAGRQGRGRVDPASAPSARFFLDGERCRQGLEDLHAAESDGSLEGYLERIVGRYPGRQFGIVLNGIHRLSDGIWWKGLEVARGLAQHVGQPVGGADLILFLNHCQESVFGLHKDALENITFVVQGRKRFLVWPYEALQELAGAPDNGRWSNLSLSGLDYRRYRDRATVLEGDPGDVIYWPTGYWHVAEWAEDSVPAATIAFAASLHAFNANSPGLLIADVLKQMDEAGKVCDAPSVYGSYLRPGSDPAANIEPILAEVAAHTERILTNPAFRRELEETTLAWLTRFGYREPPPELPIVEMDEDDVVQPDPRYPIVWKQYASDDVVCSIHGRILTCPPRLLPVVRALNRGESRRVGSLIAELACVPADGQGHGWLTKEEVISALQQLYSVRALRLCRSGRTGVTTQGEPTCHELSSSPRF